MPNGTNPDYLIEGIPFDCYAPAGTTSPRNVASSLGRKAQREQARRFVLNLDDWDGDVVALRQQFRDWPVPDVDEVIIVRDGTISHFIP